MGREALSRAVINKKPIGVNWEFAVYWLFIGSVVTVSYWLGCCRGSRQTFFLLWGSKVEWTCKVSLFLLGLQLMTGGRV